MDVPDELFPCGASNPHAALIMRESARIRLGGKHHPSGSPEHFAIAAATRALARSVHPTLRLFGDIGKDIMAGRQPRLLA